MRNKKTKLRILPILCFFAAGLLFPGDFQQKEKGKDQRIDERKSLIRKELLNSLNKTLIPPKRNIFTRWRAGEDANEISAIEEFRTFQVPQVPGQKRASNQQGIVLEENRIGVTYIGYVKSGERVVALIIFEGDTYAVESGDVLDMGLTIGEITPDDMEIFDNGAEPRRINLEGERP